ncbi:unnamed protein product [Spirodela intermedia]|uniref:Uncharacterized protein n=1 Tax=Spirodela intermedia TaxID=51605 RepID=A0A7I8J6L8_SPIIN|nr:unnamed protein product [Spirodela intermedia]CAA6665751.1 unnamed protein product [Spirodela intermedia]
MAADSTDRGIRQSPALSAARVDPRVHLNRAHAVVYSGAVLALLYHRAVSLLSSTSLLSFFLFLTITVAELVLAFMWALSQFPERLPEVVDPKDWPGLDVFVCTADPHREPPMGLVNTVLSAMGFDYPAEKLSVYVSDDGGSQLTLLALVEAARFARHWLPFCRERRLVDRSPEAYFRNTDRDYSDGIKAMYERMKEKVEGVVERGRVIDEDLPEADREVFGRWTSSFTRHDHPSVIQVLLESRKDLDTTGAALPNLVYVSREKNRAFHHNFKAGALNALVRVSGIMSNGHVVLTLDCDMFSNDPQTAQRALCYLLDPAMVTKLAYVQFPQRFRGIDENDIYANEGPMYLGTGCFFSRRALHELPSPLCSSTDDDDGLADGGSSSLLCKAEKETIEPPSKSNLQMGFRYGSIVEDFNTGYELHCEGWESVFCHPQRAAFLGEMPININNVLNQLKRWCVGFLEVAFSKHSPVVYGIRKASLPMGMCYSMISLWGIWCFPIMVYSVLPQMALAHQIPLFPKALDPWFWLYAYLFSAAYGQELVDFLMAGGTIRRWWNDQRMWMLRGATSHLFGVIEFSLKQIGSPAPGFNLTSKVVDDQQSARYKRGVFDFGAESPFSVSLGTVSMVNLSCFVVGLARAIGQRDVERMTSQLLISGFVMANYWPVYEAMFLRRDSGKIPGKIITISALLAGALHGVGFLVLGA